MSVPLTRTRMFKEPDMRELVAYIGRLEQYFDAEAYARDLIAAEKGVFFPNGSDADKRNAFSIEKYLSTRLRPKPEDVYEVYESTERG